MRRCTTLAIQQAIVTDQRPNVRGFRVHRLSVALVVVSLAVISAIGAMDRGVAAEDVTPAASPPGGCPATTEDENEAIARRWHEDVITNHDLTVLDEILAPDADHDSATFSDNPGPRAVLGALLSGFPDVRHTVEAVITEGDLVVIRYRATGTHTGEFQGYAPTGKPVTWTGINIYRIECGRIAEIWSEVDAQGRIAQLTGLATAATPAAGTPEP
jgi:predicted ester cyclase